jgi:nanoRNase/pAp phosphatase (c-di-AMP/oligoRNAs hydrolase)
MELTPHEQIIEQIKKANRLLVALPESLSIDALASGLALKAFLEKQKKDVSLASSGEVPEQLKFLPGSETVISALSSGKSLVVVVDTSEKKLEELSYETTENKASIFLKAKDGQVFLPQDISFAKEKAPYDLIFILDAPVLSLLGGLFEQNADLFYETPKINIDHKAENEFYGAINLVDLSATSVGEILCSLFEKFEQYLIDENIATCLLAGIISKTDSFQHIKTTPKSFLTASQLIEAGGRQQEIVQALYKTKPLNLLRLWGRILAKLKTENDTVYSVLSGQDFEKSGASSALIPQSILDLIANLSGKKAAAVLAQENGGPVEIFLAAYNGLNLDKFILGLGKPVKTTALSPHNYQLLVFSLPQISLAEAETKFSEILKGL